jgi:hypothetical protein
MWGNKFFDATTRLIPSTEVWVDKARAANYTENGSIQYPFRGVQAAIDGTTGSVAIHLVPATYTEDITISRSGIHMVSHDTAQYRSGAQITGKFTYDIPAGGSCYASGITFLNSADHTIHFTGVGAQKLFLAKCAVRNTSPGAHHCFLNDNTAASELTADDVLFRHQDVSGGGQAIHATAASASVHRIWKGNILIDTLSAVAVEALGTGTFELNHEDVQGTMAIRGTVGLDIENTRLTSSIAPVLDYTSTFAIGSRMRNVQVITAPSPAIIGTGTIHQANTVWEFTGAGFAPTITLVPTGVESALNSIYDPSASSLPFSSTRVKTALDEIGAILAGAQLSAVDVEDEGSGILTALLNTLNFTGPGVTVSEGAAGEAIIDVPGGISGLSNQRYFILGSHNFSTGQYDALRIASNGNASIVFAVPDDFGSLNSIEAIGIPEGTSGAADIDLISQYAAEGEDKATNTESDLVSTYNFPTVDEVTALDMSSVFSSLAVGDFGACNIDHNTIGFAVNYIAVKLDYVVS